MALKGNPARDDDAAADVMMMIVAILCLSAEGISRTTEAEKEALKLKRVCWY